METPSQVHTGSSRFYSRNVSELFSRSREYLCGPAGSYGQMQACVRKTGPLYAGGFPEISNGGQSEWPVRARSRRCMLHILAILRRPRTARFQWEGIVRELRGVETRVRAACNWSQAGS